MGEGSIRGTDGGLSNRGRFGGGGGTRNAGGHMIAGAAMGNRTLTTSLREKKYVYMYVYIYIGILA